MSLEIENGKRKNFSQQKIPPEKKVSLKKKMQPKCFFFAKSPFSRDFFFGPKTKISPENKISCQKKMLKGWNKPAKCVLPESQQKRCSKVNIAQIKNVKKNSALMF
jgi:hypothetical protein